MIIILYYIILYYIIRIILKEYDKHCVLNTLNSVCLEVEKYLELT